MQIEDALVSIACDELAPVTQPSEFNRNDPLALDSSSSSMIKLDVDASEGESLDSQILKAVMESQKERRQQLGTTEITRSSKELARSLLKNKSKEDSTRVLADQIESLREMERQNELLTSQVRQTVQLVTGIEKTLRKK